MIKRGSITTREYAPVYKGLCTDGDVRLEGGDREHEGRIDVCYNGSWATLCGDRIDDFVAEVTCRQLGYSLHSESIVSLQCDIPSYTAYRNISPVRYH